jgi:V/A-type H+-transporting ATPase subunit I
MSYIRLFALGLAGGLLGAAFNTIAFNLITKDGQVHYASPLIIGTILILVVGHSINFGLSIIGAFVHPLRLTFVEFYSNLGFMGGGKPYRPFRQLKTVEKSQQ